jgi:hypothetical protein
VAVNCCVVPAAIEGFPGSTAIDTSTGAVTVTVVEPLIGLIGGLVIIGVSGVTPVATPNGVIVTKVAAIVVLPSETLVASPLALIVVTPGADELHMTEAVRFWVLPLLK